MGNSCYRSRGGVLLHYINGELLTASLDDVMKSLNMDMASPEKHIRDRALRWLELIDKSIIKKL